MFVLFCCERGIDIKNWIARADRAREILCKYWWTFAFVCVSDSMDFAAATRIFEIFHFHTLCCLIYICVIQIILIHFFRFFLIIIATFSGNKRRNNSANEFYVSRKGLGLLRRCWSRLPSLSYVRWTGTSIQLPLPKRDAFSTANANLRSLVHGWLSVFGGKLRF